MLLPVRYCDLVPFHSSCLQYVSGFRQTRLYNFARFPINYALATIEEITYLSHYMPRRHCGTDLLIRLVTQPT
jgi:hypothetical protein